MSGLLVVCLDGTGENWRECADVLFSSRPRPAADAWLLAGLVLRRYPGCLLVLLAVTEGACVARARCGVVAHFPGRHAPVPVTTPAWAPAIATHRNRKQPKRAEHPADARQMAQSARVHSTGRPTGAQSPAEPFTGPLAGTASGLTTRTPAAVTAFTAVRAVRAVTAVTASAAADPPSDARRLR